jgi:hypothetical protein
MMTKRKRSAKAFAFWKEYIEGCGALELLRNDALGGVFDPAVSRAGKFLGLDAAKPDDAALMLRILAYQLFPTEKKPKGRPQDTKKWNSNRLFLLGLHRVKIAEMQPGINDTIAATRIMAEYKKEYRDTTVEMIRQRLSLARLVFETAMAGFRAFEKEKASGNTSARADQFTAILTGRETV